MSSDYEIDDDVVMPSAVGTMLALNPAPRSTARLRLSTIGECTREMARVYKEARQKQLDPAVATRLVYILQTIANMIRDHSLEERVEALENRK